ncbi:hypothetical protein HOG98_06460 [bacterium]|jgi:tetratricopeptide (TPR) repeat protein|nr:hypothetical protein [bacterium]
MLVQNTVPRSKSLKMRLADQAWAWGPGAIFLEGVPFSLRGGRLFAKKLVDVFLSRVEEKRVPITVAEFGPGLGFLSLHFMDILKETNNDVYDLTTLKLIDIDRKMLNPLENSQAFSRHDGRIKFEEMDAAEITGTWDNFLFAFSCNLIDSFRSRHFHVKNGELFELQVSTKIKEDAQLLDTTQDIPVVLDTKGISELISNLRDDHNVLFSRLGSVLEEEFTSIPIESVTDLTETDRDRLSRFMNTIKTPAEYTFNYCSEIFTHIKTVMDNLSENGLYFASDFGFSNEVVKYEPINLMTSYGVTQFCSVCFPLVSHFVKECNGESIITEHELDQTQDMIIAKGSVSEDLRERFEALFSTFDFSDVSNKIEEISAENELNYVEKLAKISKLLSSDEREDYYFLKTVALQLFAEDHNEKALEMANKLIHRHKDLGVDAFMIKGWVYQKINNHDEALTYFDKVLEFCENDSIAHASIGLSSIVLGNFEKAIHHFKTAIYYSRSNEIWQWVFGLAMSYTKNGDIDTGRQILEFPTKLEAGDLIHPSIQEKFVHALEPVLQEKS